MTDQPRQPIAIDYSLPDFSFTVDGQTYSLRYDFGAFRAYQKVTGVNPFSAGFTVNKDNLDIFLWAGLQRGHAGIALEKVQEWLTPATAVPLLELVGEAYYAVFPPVPAAEGTSADPPSA